MRHPQRLPPRGHAHAEERPAGHGTLRRGLRQGDAPWRHDIRLHAQLLQQGPLRQRPRGGECRQRCGAGDELLPLRRALRRPGGSGGRIPAALQVQRQGAGDDARPEHLRLRSEAVQPDRRQVGQDGSAL